MSSKEKKGERTDAKTKKKLLNDYRKWRMTKDDEFEAVAWDKEREVGSRLCRP